MTEPEQDALAAKIAEKIRPTLAQMAAAGAVRGCPRCGCEDSRIVDSRDNGDGRRRVRVCRHCKQQFTTVEVAVR